MKTFLMYALALFVFVLVGCEKEAIQPDNSRDVIIEDDSKPASCKTASWDLSCFMAGEIRTFSVDVPNGTSARWVLTENENEFAIVGSDTAPTVSIRALNEGQAKINVAVTSASYFCSSCEDLCF